MLIPTKGIAYEVTSQIHGQQPLSNGRRQPCMDMELNAAECIEAYGINKGMDLCFKFLEDLSECRHGRLRGMRTRIMKEERLKKVIKGEIPFSKRWGTQYPYDAFVTGTFLP